MPYLRYALQAVVKVSVTTTIENGHIMNAYNIYTYHIGYKPT